MKKPVKRIAEAKEPTKLPAIDRQERFIQEYLVDFNATRAAIRAGYSPKTAKEQASRLLSNVNLREKINQRRKELLSLVQLQQFDAWQRLKEQSEFDPGDLYTDGNILKDIQEIPPERRKFLKAYKVKSKVAESADGKTRELFQETEVQFIDPARTTELMLKATGVLEEEGKDSGITAIQVNINWGVPQHGRTLKNGE